MEENKPKVSTRTRDNEGKKDKIIKSFREHQEGLTPKLSSSYTGLNHNTTKGYFRTMEREGIIKNISGFYRLVDNSTHRAIFEWKFHNLILQCLVPNYQGEKINQTISSVLINYRFGIGKKSKKATLHISSKYPINISSIELAFNSFSYLVNKYSQKSPTSSETMIRSIELNKDFINLLLDGINCVTLNSLFEQFKIYQKKEGVRLEHRIKPTFTAEALVSALFNSNNSIDLNNRVKNIENSQVELVKNYKKISGLLLKMLEKS